MRAALILIAGGILGGANAWAGANCEHSASWQCGAQISGSTQGSQTGGGISTTGHTPDPGTTNQHLGTVTAGGTQPPVQVVPAQAIPPQPPEQKVPTPLPPEQVKAPPQITQKVPQPIKTPPDPPQIPQGQPQLVVTPPQPPEQKVPTPLPPEQVKAPPQITQKVPQPIKTPPDPPQQKVPVPEQVKVPPQIAQQVPPLATPHPVDVHRPPVVTGTPPSGTVPGTSGTVPGAGGNIPGTPGGVTGTVGQPPTGGTHTPVGGTFAGKSKPDAHKIVSLPHSPNVAPPKPAVVAVPGKPTPVVTGSQVAEGHTHYLVPTAPNTQLPHGISASVWLDEVIEPGIENHKVELYRSNDAQEVLYKDAIPMDKTGFHLKVVGTRPPNYH
jgi:hypothetical protein